MGDPEKTEDPVDVAAWIKAEMAAEQRRREAELNNARKTKRIDIERIEVEALAKGKLNGKERPKAPIEETAKAKTKFDEALDEEIVVEEGPKAEDEEEALKAEAPVPGTDLGPEEERKRRLIR
jgi:hypothetical protein